MVTNIHLGSDGRLGNQLFQYAALRSLSLHNNFQCTLPKISNVSWHGQQCLLSQFNLNCSYTDDFSSLQYEYNEPNLDTFDSGFFNIPDNTSIRGFFQNLKYFEKYSDIIKTELTPVSDITDKAQTIINRYKDKYPGHEFVSIHIRRGDNININTEFGSKLFGTGIQLSNESIWAKYISNAKEVFNNKNVKYLIFTGGNRDNDDSADIQWVNANFDSNNHILASTSDVLLDYSLISLCDHNILCHATTFGWWAAYINKNPNKLMIIPSDYFLNGKNANRLINNEFLTI